MARKMLEFAVNLSMMMSGNVATESTKTAQKLSELHSKLQTLGKTGKLMQSFQGQREKLEALRQKMVAAREKVRVLRDEMNRTENPSAALQKKFAQAQKEAGQLGVKFQEQRKKLADLNSELLKSGVNTSKLVDEQNKLAAQTDKVKAAQDRLTAAQDKYNALRAKVFDWGNIKADVLQSMAMIKTFQQPIKVDMQFEQAMANVRSVSNPNPQDFTRLRNQAIELGSTTQFTATQAANAQETLIRAGLSVSETLEAMPALLSMSAAEGLEISQAADIIVKTLGGFRLNTGYSQILTDLYAYTSANANTNIAELGEAMSKLAPVAATVNIPAESAFALLASMTSAARGGEAGTALAAELPRMYAPTKAVLDAYRELGVTYRTRDKDGKTGVVRPEVLLKNIADKAKPLGQDVQMRLFERIFGKNHLSAMVALMKNIQAGEFDTMQAGLITQRDGASSRMAGIRNDTLQGDITSLGSAWEGLMIRIGNTLEPINRTVIQSLTTGITYINQFIDRNKSLVEIASRASYIFGGFMVIKKVSRYASLLYQTFGAWLELRTATKAAEMATIGTHMAGAATSAKIFGLSINSALGIVGLLSIAAYEVYANWDKIKAFFNNWVIPNIWEPLVAWCSETIESVRNMWRDFMDWLAGFNPFSNWKAPSAETLQRQETQMRNSPQGQNAQAISDRFRQAYTPHAKGGILTQPHLGLVAEAGPEAIIPLRDKSRGLEVLSSAMKILGVPEISPSITQTIGGIFSASPSTNSNDIFSPQTIGGMISPSTNSSDTYSPQTIGGIISPSTNSNDIFSPQTIGGIISPSTNSNTNTFSPNITINVSGTQDTDIASRIKQAVLDALEEISSYRERVAYA